MSVLIYNNLTCDLFLAVTYKICKTAKKFQTFLLFPWCCSLVVALMLRHTAILYENKVYQTNQLDNHQKRRRSKEPGLV